MPGLSPFRSLIVLAILPISGCFSSPECGHDQCAEVCQAAEPVPDNPSATAALSTFEQELLSSYLEDIRAGVRPFNDQTVGICTHQSGSRTCPEFIGLDAGELPPGDYQLFGEFAVPRLGEDGTWMVKLEWSCETVRDDGKGNTRTSTNTNSQEYKLRYAGKEKGYRLSPMVTISSPHKYGKRTCSYTLTSPHPSGAKVIEGSWSVPAEE